jgi:hypothetical protein
MKPFWTYYAILIAAFVALDVVAVIKFWRKQRIRQKQIARRRREYLRSLPIEMVLVKR